ncbi:MAG: hypothetical protein NVS3B26_22950 [Mycobacteriales bacterium]
MTLRVRALIGKIKYTDGPQNVPWGSRSPSPSCRSGGYGRRQAPSPTKRGRYLRQTLAEPWIATLNPQKTTRAERYSGRLGPRQILAEPNSTRCARRDARTTKPSASSSQNGASPLELLAMLAAGARAA